MALLGLGFRSVSMSPASIGPVKAMLLGLDVDALASVMNDALDRHGPDRADARRAEALRRNQQYSALRRVNRGSASPRKDAGARTPSGGGRGAHVGRPGGGRLCQAGRPNMPSCSPSSPRSRGYLKAKEELAGLRTLLNEPGTDREMRELAEPGTAGARGDDRGGSNATC